MVSRACARARVCKWCAVVRWQVVAYATPRVYSGTHKQPTSKGHTMAQATGKLYTPVGVQGPFTPGGNSGLAVVTHRTGEIRRSGDQEIIPGWLSAVPRLRLRRGARPPSALDFARWWGSHNHWRLSSEWSLPGLIWSHWLPRRAQPGCSQIPLARASIRRRMRCQSRGSSYFRLLFFHPGIRRPPCRDMSGPPSRWHRPTRGTGRRTLTHRVDIRSTNGVRCQAYAVSGDCASCTRARVRRSFSPCHV